MIEIIDDLKGFPRLESIWHELESSEHIRIFQTYLWCHSAWDFLLEKDKNNRLWILHWSNADDHIIFPTYIDTSGKLRFIYDTDSDVCDALYQNGKNHNVAYYEISKIIKEEQKIKGVWLQKLRGNSEALNYLGVMLKGGIISKDNAYSWLEVNPSGDFISDQRHMKSKDRADLKCMKRQYSKYRIIVYSKKTKDKFPEKEILELRNEMCENGKRNTDYFQQDSIDFTKKIYENNGCNIALLEDETGVQAVNILLIKNNRILSWVFFYKNPQTSTALYLKYFCECMNDEPYIFDFGVGVYSYKIGTFRPCVENTFSIKWNNTIYGFIKIFTESSMKFVKEFIKARIK